MNPETAEPEGAPDNPTAALLGQVAYPTEALEAELGDFEIVERDRFELGTRGYFLRRP